MQNSVPAVMRGQSKYRPFDRFGQFNNCNVGVYLYCLFYLNLKGNTISIYYIYSFSNIMTHLHFKSTFDSKSNKIG